MLDFGGAIMANVREVYELRYGYSSAVEYSIVSFDDLTHSVTIEKICKLRRGRVGERGLEEWDGERGSAHAGSFIGRTRWGAV